MSFPRAAAWAGIAALGLAGCGHGPQHRTDQDAAPAGGGVRLRWQVDPADARNVRVEVAGLKVAARRAAPEKAGAGQGQWGRLLSVHVQGPTGEPLEPAMLGAYDLVEDRLRFTPAYPLREGSSYIAVVPVMDGGARLTSSHTVPAREQAPATVVEHIYPSADLLPENLLKFYLHFSAPMSRGQIYDHIDLLDEEGNTIVLPFLELDEELWNPELTRVTLLIDPGRIKRGVRPLEEVGPSLQVGRAYTLRIGREWRDARGVPLVSEARKAFRITVPDRAPPDPRRWTIVPPESRTRKPLVVTFLEPMDHALALRLIGVRNAQGEPVPGASALAREEMEWRFTPQEAWPSGSMTLVVDTVLEDLAGNSVGKPFEVDLFERVERRVASEAVSVPFEIP